MYLRHQSSKHRICTDHSSNAPSNNDMLQQPCALMFSAVQKCEQSFASVKCPSFSLGPEPQAQCKFIKDTGILVHGASNVHELKLCNDVFTSLAQVSPWIAVIMGAVHSNENVGLHFQQLYRKTRC